MKDQEFKNLCVEYAASRALVVSAAAQLDAAQINSGNVYQKMDKEIKRRLKAGLSVPSKL